MSYNYTKLYVDGLPVDYNIIVKEKHFIFEPGYNPHEDLNAPAFVVKNENNKLHFENLDDESLRHQAEEEIREYLKRTGSAN